MKFYGKDVITLIKNYFFHRTIFLALCNCNLWISYIYDLFKVMNIHGGTHIFQYVEKVFWWLELIIQLMNI